MEEFSLWVKAVKGPLAGLCFRTDVEELFDATDLLSSGLRIQQPAYLT